MSLDEDDPEQVEALLYFQDLFEQAARVLAVDLFAHGRAVAEIRRTPDGKIVGLDPIDVTTIHRICRHCRYGDDVIIEYEQRIAGRDPIRIAAADLLVITREN